MVITQLAAKFPRIVFYSHHLEIQIPTGAYKTSKILKIKIVPPMVYKEIVIWKKRLTLFITWKYRKCLLIKEKKKRKRTKTFSSCTFTFFGAAYGIFYIPNSTVCSS